jgi:CO/xanthine dehydrogenase Mo-binding subunit
LNPSISLSPPASAAPLSAVSPAAGAQRYTADLSLENSLHVKLVLLSCASARIHSIDTRAAEQVEGVRLVLTVAGLPQPVPHFGPNQADRPDLPFDETKFSGEPFAAVAAETEDAADYEELPPVLTIDSALDPSAALVQHPSTPKDRRLAHTNVLEEWHFGWGDVASAQPACIVENDYTFPTPQEFGGAHPAGTCTPPGHTYPILPSFMLILHWKPPQPCRPVHAHLALDNSIADL